MAKLLGLGPTEAYHPMPTMGAGAVHSIKSAGQAQRFLSAHDGINNLFQIRRDHVAASEYRAARGRAFEVWSEISGIAARA